MSNLSLERLLFDPANVTDSPRVGSHILGLDGNVIDSTDVDGTEGLNVNILNPLSVDIDGIYDNPDNLLPDNIGIIAHTRAAIPGAAEQVERTTAGVPADDVTNANIHALDVNSFLMGYDGSAWDRITATSGSLNVNVTNTSLTIGADADDATSTFNPISVGGTSYNQSTALGALSAAADRGHMLMDLYRRIFINDAPNRAVASVNKGLTDAAAALVATELAGRTRVLIQNIGGEPCELGPSGVTYGSGLRLEKGTTLALEAGEAIALYGICNTSKTTNVRVFELA